MTKFEIGSEKENKSVRRQSAQRHLYMRIIKYSSTAPERSSTTKSRGQDFVVRNTPDGIKIEWPH